MIFIKKKSNLPMVGIAFLIFAALPMSAYALPAFPGAQGFGSTTIGGRGGKVIKVTNLNDSGTGSLRAALTASGPRIVVFSTGGTITLSSAINITNPYLTVAGQTAPGGGILIKGAPGTSSNTLVVQTHDVIIRGLRIRQMNRAGIEISSTSSQAYNIIVDHNSISWSLDGLMGLWTNPHHITFSWNNLSEACNSTSHAAATLIGGFDGCEVPGNSISIHHNLYAHSSYFDRTPLIKQRVENVEFINNLVFNWYSNSASKTMGNKSYFAKNHYIRGNWSSNWEISISGSSECSANPPPAASVMVTHNLGPHRLTDTGDDWLVVSNGVSSSYRTNSPPFTLSGITETAVTGVETALLAGVGATVPYRDAVDTRIIGYVTNRTGQICMTPNDAAIGGFPTINPGTPPTDIDGDGIPDAWETAHGLNPNNASDANTNASSGYTWIEEYINNLFPLVVAPPPVPSHTPNPPAILPIS